ncbi:MAG: PD-(D/E)XK nuclease family protein [Muribaculaceae bacterium]
MEPFLKTVANTYLNCEPQQLADYTFVFPNRRSSLFFAKHIKTIAAGKAMIMPEISTISDFISEFSGIEEASSIELLFILYKEYKKLRMAEGAEDGSYSFDKFLFIGNIIIQDFNDIDLFNADAERVLTNTSELKEIKSTYLSKELVEILNHYFNISNMQGNSESENFWTHVKGDKRISQKYLSLWKMLYHLYTGLRQSLKEIGKGYSGLIYRTALDNILKMNKEDFRSSRYIFVGFNALSTTEFLIFNKMKNLELADFYWDYNCEIVKKASAFMEENTKHFPSRYDINENGTIAGEINVYGIPSNIGQLKYAAEITKKIYNEKEDVATAIVLPNEALYLPALSMIPQLGIDKVNVTFGIPLKNTSIAILMSEISTMHSHARSINGIMQFRKEDVAALLAFPIVRALDKEKAEGLRKELSKLKSMFVPSETFVTIKGTGLEVIFSHVEKLGDRNEVFQYICDLIDTLEKRLPGEQSFDKIYIDAYREAIEEIKIAITILGNEEIGINSMFYLVDRLVATLSHNLKGEPLSGLQIMGFLESRCLDFKNVIITSVNEKILPKKTFNQSFIPGHIRKAYGIATNEFQESLYSYYFYRLISRAENVYLLYDSRKQSFGAGEYSRYIYQLKYLHDGIKIHFFNPKFARENENQTCAATPAADAADPNSISVQKDNRIMGIINKFFDKNEETNYKFSASAFKEYFNCPLNFYFEYIEGLRFEDHEDSFIDSATFGTIVHDVLSKIYEINKEYKYPQDFDSLRAKVPDAINNAINEIYLDRPLGTPIDGSAKYIFSVVKDYVERTIEYDAHSAPFTIIEMEEKYKDGLKINGQHINFSFTIDRLQERDGCIEIIDYKTGSDEPFVADIENIKDQKSYKKHSIFQLLLYCEAYLQKNPNEKRSIIPKMYSFREIYKDLNYCSTIKINRKEINYNNQDTRDEFTELFKEIIDEIRNQEVPFSQTTDGNCSFCGFKEICRK